MLLGNDRIFSPKTTHKYSEVSKIVLINRIILKVERAHHTKTSEAKVGGIFKCSNSIRKQ